MNGRNIRGLFSTVLVFLLVASVASAQHWVGVGVTEAQIDDVVITPYAWNRLSLERDSEFELELHLESYRAAEDVEIQAFITGYEYNDVESIRAQIGPFDFDENVTYVKRLDLTLPEDLEEDDYKLRVFISDRDGFETSLEYDLKVDVPRHKLQIEDVLLTPGSSVKAGSSLLASVRVENQGEKDEEDVKVIMSIPELNVQASEYIEEIDSGDEEKETEELYLRLPRCAEAKEYKLQIDVIYNNGHDRTSAISKLNVLENEACAPVDNTVVVVDQEAQTVQEPQEQETVEPKKTGKSNLRTALEVILIVLIGLLILVGLVIGFSRMRSEE